MKKHFLLMIGLISFGFTLQAQQLTDSLIVFYNFQGNCTDNSGHNLNGTVSGPTLTTDRMGYANSAYDFDGVNDIIVLPASNKLKPALPVTVSFWAKSNKTSGQDPVFGNNYQTDKYHGFNISISNSKISLSYGDGGGLGSGNRRTKQSNLQTTPAKWHHIVGVIRGATDMDIYIDNVDAGGTYSGSGGAMQYSTGSVNLGNFEASSNFFNGSLDKFAMWNRALSSAEVKELFEKYLDVRQEPKATQVSVFPNPASDILSITANQSNYGLGYELYDLSGKIINQGIIESEVTSINIKDLSPGMYIIRIGNNSYKVFKN